MSHNKILLYFCGAITITSCFLTGIAVGWEDHPDVGTIDHFFDIHVDYDRMVADAMEEKARADARDANIKEWVKDIKSFGHEDTEGTCTYTPDRDK